MKKIILISVLIIAIVARFTATVSAQDSTTKTEVVKVEYTCTMHPEVISDKTGQCPKCGMDLVKKVAKVEYTCSMHPEIILDKPGKCPKCGMELVKKDKAANKKGMMKMGCGMMGM
jgi:hypothetical protein